MAATPRPGDPVITPALVAEHGLTPDEYERHENAQRDKSWSGNGIDVVTGTLAYKQRRDTLDSLARVMDFALNLNLKAVNHIDGRPAIRQLTSRRLAEVRKKMAEKIQAMSMEAKASAGIIGALPPIVMILVYLTTPEYISLLWIDPKGQLMLVGCVIWMSIGVMVMKKMINFDF